MSNTDPSANQPHPAQPSYAPPAYGSGYGQPGAPYPYVYPYGYAPAPRTNTLAVVSFVAAFVFSAAAVVTGHLALSQIKRTGEGGRGLAIAGLTIGYIGVGFAVLFFLIWLSLFIGILGHGFASGSIPS